MVSVGLIIQLRTQMCNRYRLSKIATQLSEDHEGPEVETILSLTSIVILTDLVRVALIVSFFS